MISLPQARELAQRRLRSKLAVWATGDAEDDATLWSLALKPPAERAVLADEAAAESWAADWRRFDAPTGVTVEWESRSWRSIGRQSVPARIRFADPAAVAAFAGGAPGRDWRTLTHRARVLSERFGDTPALHAAVRRHAATLLRYEPTTFARLLEVIAWTVEHPTTGYRPRQLPIRGVDSKWFGAHRGTVASFRAAVIGNPELGIVESDRLVRVRVLDERLAANGPYDFASPVPELARLELQPGVLFVFENLETVLAMPKWSDAVVIHGTGYAVDTIASIPWVQRAQIVYWGDLDSHGFGILHRLRTHHPRVESVLMDADTLLAHRDLWVAEEAPTRGGFSSLTAAEHEAFELLKREGDARLEQERIPWDVALHALRSAAASATGRAAASDVES